MVVQKIIKRPGGLYGHLPYCMAGAATEAGEEKDEKYDEDVIAVGGLFFPLI